MRRYPHLWISTRGPGSSGTSTHLKRALPGAQYEPLRPPKEPGLSLAGCQLAIPDLSTGLPVLPALSLATGCCHYPGAAIGRRHRSFHPTVSAFPGRVTRSACTSTFSRLARHSRVLRPAHAQLPPFRGTLTEGFSHLVTSMTAPVASGWSVRRVELTPTGKAPPYHGAHPNQSQAEASTAGD